MMGPGMPPLPNDALKNKMKAQKPKDLTDVPRFLREVLGGTFKRLVYIFKLIWEAKKSLLFLNMFMTLYNGVMPLVGTLISANLIGKIVLSFTEDVNLMIPLALQFGYIFVNSLIGSLNSIITRISGEVVTNHIKTKIMRKAKDVDLASFDMPDFYERLENANREAGMRPVNIMSNSFSMISHVISLVSFTVVLIGLLSQLGWESYLFFGIFIALSITSAIVGFYFRRQNFLYMRHRSKDRRQLSYYSDIMVNKDIVKEIKLFGLADLFIGRYNDIFKNYFKGIKRLICREGVWNIFMAMATASLNAVLFYMIATNISKIEDYSIYTSALNSVSSCISGIITIAASIYEGSLFIDNMIIFMNEKKTIVSSLPEPIKPKRHCGHTIELRDVCFAYPGSDRLVLKNINLTLNAGDTAVLVGLNGAGKTTLIKLLTRLYDPTSGEILLDGRNIKEYDTDELYKMYGIIFQDFGKYAVSVKDNISFGQIDRNHNDGDIRDAAVASSADAFINDLPNKYDTPLMRYFEENGIELSIGQWQKLSIARAFYSDSDILILDEPTASLDPMAEQEIFNQFDRLRKDKTTIFVSHRLSSATSANKIIVLKYGEIVEIGDHRTLMAQGGEYYTLFSTQAKRYISSENETVLADQNDIPEGLPPFPLNGKLHPPFPSKGGRMPRPPMLSGE